MENNIEPTRPNVETVRVRDVAHLLEHSSGLRQSGTELAELFNTGRPVTVETLLQDCLYALSLGEGQHYIVFVYVDGVYAGFSFAYKTGKDRAFIHAIHSNHLLKDFAKHCMLGFKVWCREQGVTQVNAESRRFSGSSARFFASLGFQKFSITYLMNV